MVSHDELVRDHEVLKARVTRLEGDFPPRPPTPIPVPVPVPFPPTPPPWIDPPVVPPSPPFNWSKLFAWLPSFATLRPWLLGLVMMAAGAGATTLYMGGCDKRPVDPVNPVDPDIKPSPFPLDGLRVLFIHQEKDATELQRKFPEKWAAMNGKTVREYLAANAKEWQVCDVDDDFSAAAKHWRDAFMLPRDNKKLPWMVVGNGKTGYMGPVPEKLSDTMAILQKLTPTGRK